MPPGRLKRAESGPLWHCLVAAASLKPLVRPLACVHQKNVYVDFSETTEIAIAAATDDTFKQNYGIQDDILCLS